MSSLARFVRLATKPLCDSADRRRLSRLYSPSYDNVDRGVHLQEAIQWLERAQEFGEDRGVSYGTLLGKGFLASYPEATGYIVKTFVELARRFDNRKYLDRAVLMGDWEIEIQLPNGAVMGGIVGENPTPAIFNTGQVLLGWSALLAATGAGRYADAARKASNWMLEMQEPDGSWLRGNSDFVLKTATVYNAKAAWGLCEAGVVLGEPRYVDAAIQNGEFCLRKQLPNGWYEDCCLSDPARPLLHTIAYSIQGLIGIGRLTGRKYFLDAADKTARSLKAQIREDGFLSGRYDRGFHGVVPWCCLTGLAQTSVVLSDLYLLDRRNSYREGVQRINDYLCRHHDVTNADPTIRGGVPGSWPVWGEYGQYKVLSWATKFLVDALLREEEILEYPSEKLEPIP